MAAAEAETAPAGPKILTNNPQETSMDVWWEAVEGAESYTVQVKEISEEWSAARALKFPGDATKQTVEGLLPTTTYEFRLIVQAAGNQLTGPSTVADTLVANCGPKCVIQ